MREQYHSNLTAASFWPPPPNMLVLRENVSPVFPQKQKAQRDIR